MTNPVWTQHFDVNTIVLDHQKQLSLVGLLNLLQDTAWIHAEQLGWGYDALVEKGTIWVLSRQKVVMKEWPMWQDKVTIRTWPRRSGALMALREFEIVAENKSGETRRIGECSTSWLVLDWNTRKVQKLDKIMFGVPSLSEGVLDISAERVPPRSDLGEIARFEVRNSDLDVNGHVNNTRYAQWVTDTLSLDEMKRYAIDEYEVNFLAETLVGDTVVIESETGTPDADGTLLRHYQGRKTTEEKPAFTARLKLRPR
ncbi:acyl-[acyl-carrier-protein] thioesterase [Rhizomicrobium electricum]|uniref:Thioesterase n=1 Tax=Rhizomicrobium electricum TaxID=480070 RepID=A0ABP3PM29_9PROT|nr:acyl-ACP thioesterase domain-containing protein [Rhizomicrobium electricum]NIJ46863.1 acyl-ACP thioesterase [Rhizomicrobium electricum]